jgi:hypothetical protein
MDKDYDVYTILHIYFWMILHKMFFIVPSERIVKTERDFFTDIRLNAS